jgi:septal ring factor EnvC (AmiA/AmiB activator)
MQMTKTSETEQLEPAALSKQSSRKSILALSVFALGLNATAAVYTMSPSEFALPDVSGLVAELLPHERAPAPVPDSVFATLKDIQTVQLQQAAALQQHSALLLQNTALLQQDSATFDALRHSLTNEKSDVKNISSQLSKLTSKVDSLQNSITSEITASISKSLARNKMSSAARKRMARSLKPNGPVSLGGAPLTIAPQGPQQSPEG